MEAVKPNLISRKSVALLNVKLQIYAFRIVSLRQWRSSQRTAPYWRLYWNENNHWQVEFRKHRCRLGPDRIVVIPPETGFISHSTGKSRQIFIHFTVDQSVVTCNPGIYEIPVNNTILEYLNQAEIAHSAIPVSPLYGTMLAYAICGTALCALSDQLDQPKKYSYPIQQAIDLMEGRIADPATVTDMAHIIGINRTDLTRLFKSETGETPYAWHLRKRIEFSCGLLHQGQMSIDEIAQAAGFADRFHFSKRFKKARGVTPAMFRRQIQ